MLILATLSCVHEMYRRGRTAVRRHYLETHRFVDHKCSFQIEGKKPLSELRKVKFLSRKQQFLSGFYSKGFDQPDSEVS